MRVTGFWCVISAFYTLKIAKGFRNRNCMLFVHARKIKIIHQYRVFRFDRPFSIMQRIREEDGRRICSVCDNFFNRVA